MWTFSGRFHQPAHSGYHRRQRHRRRRRLDRPCQHPLAQSWGRRRSYPKGEYLYSCSVAEWKSTILNSSSGFISDMSLVHFLTSNRKVFF